MKLRPKTYFKELPNISLFDLADKIKVLLNDRIMACIYTDNDEEEFLILFEKLRYLFKHCSLISFNDKEITIMVHP